MSAVTLHTFEQLDQGVATCLNCNQLSTSASPICAGRQIPVAIPDNRDTLRREIDRLARQMGRMMTELQALRQRV